MRVEPEPASALFCGAGPGARTADGCPVELYRQLPYLDDLAPLAAHLQRARTVLELGCGTGRLTRPLLTLGLTVIAVDQSAEMLAHAPPTAQRVCAEVATLDLQRTVDVVLAASCLINDPRPTAQAALLACARRHLGPQGVLLVERHDPTWLRTARVGPLRAAGAVALTVEAVEQRDGVTAMTLRYDIGTASWRHSFHAQPLDDADVAAELAAHGFGAPQWLGAARRWAAAQINS